MEGQRENNGFFGYFEPPFYSALVDCTYLFICIYTRLAQWHHVCPRYCHMALLIRCLDGPTLLRLPHHRRVFMGSSKRSEGNGHVWQQFQFRYSCCSDDQVPQWWAMYDKTTKQPYYYDNLTGETHWVMPKTNLFPIPLRHALYSKYSYLPIAPKMTPLWIIGLV